MDDLQRTVVRPAIKRHYLFASFSESEIEGLLDGCRVYQLDADAFLFRQDDKAERFFLVGDGQIKLFRTSVEGNEKVVEIITPGQTVAEAVLFMQRQHYPVSAQAIRPARVYGIDGAAYVALLETNRDANMRIIADLSMRLHARLNDVVNLTQQNATYRVVRYLFSLLPRDAENGVLVTLNTPKQVIASRLSVKPETLSRIMANLAQKGIVDVKGREIVVKDIERLNSFE